MHLVLDLGGVLLHWRPDRLVARALPHRADDAPALARALFAHPDGEWHRYDLGQLDRDEVVAGLSARVGLTPDEARAVVAEVPRELVPADRAVALLGRLRDAGHTLFFLSNMPGPEADRLERDHRFFDWFADGVFSARVGLAKPDRAVFDLAAERFGVPAESLLFVDDHAPNIEAARAAGWQALHFTGTARCQADLVALGAFPG